MDDYSKLSVIYTLIKNATVESFYSVDHHGPDKH